MRKIIFIILLFTISSKLTAQVKPETIFLYHLGVVENFVKIKYSEGTCLDDSSKFLENLTEIKSDAVEGQEYFYFPSKENLKAWRKWFRKNKKRLKWDRENNRMSLE